MLLVKLNLSVVLYCCIIPLTDLTEVVSEGYNATNTPAMANLQRGQGFLSRIFWEVNGGSVFEKQVYHKKIIFQQIEQLCKLFLQQMVFLIHFYRLKFVQPIN